MSIDWALLEREFDDHDWSDPALERAAAGDDTVTRRDLIPGFWASVGVWVLISGPAIGLGVLIGFLL